MFMSDRIIKEWLNDTSFEEKLDNALEANSIKVCKEFGLSAEETAKKLKLNITEVKIVYKFDDKDMIDWTAKP